MKIETTLDASLFDPARVDDETRKLNETIEQALADAPRIDSVPAALTRKQREEGQGALGPIVRVDEAADRVVEALGTSVPVRVIVPEPVRGVYLHIHGGGWTIGAAHHSDVSNLAIAQRAGLAVVSVEYRLAPEDPYPAGPDDCECAAAWLVRNAQAEFGTTRLHIGGESAGAHLAAVTLLRMRDRHGFTGFERANLVYGCYDLGLLPAARSWGERNLVLNTPIIEWFADNFVARERVGDPDVSPLYADLSDMPDALFSIGTLDPLIDDSLFMHARWIAAGNRADLRVYPGGVHAFNNFPTALAQEANRAAIDFLSA